MKKRIIKKITYKHKDGEILEGFRVIEGTRDIRQIIVYKEQYMTDDATYKKEQEALMEAIAQQIMFEFAIGRTLNARKYSPGVKF